METNHDRTAGGEDPDDTTEWLLDLGLDVETGRRPWLRVLVGVPVMLGAAFWSWH